MKPSDPNHPFRRPLTQDTRDWERRAEIRRLTRLTGVCVDWSARSLDDLEDTDIDTVIDKLYELKGYYIPGQIG